MTDISPRRGFLRGAAGLAAAAQALSAAPRPLTEKEKLARLATNCWPVRMLFKSRPSPRGTGPQVAELRKKYGEITMLDFPQWTRDQFPGITHMDLWSSVFGDVSDDSMFAAQTTTLPNGQTRTMYEFDPSSASGKKWLTQLANNMAKLGVKCQHVSNNAPRNISDLDEAKRREGIEVAKKWLDGSAMLGAKTMRVNTGGPRIAPEASATGSYPRNDEIVKYLDKCIESFREMAEYGAKVGVIVTIENHWGLSANPMNVRIVLDSVNHPYCEASPDFCNWEHEYMLYHGLSALAPYTHHTVHAKYWNRWKEVDLQRCTRIMAAAGFRGIFALEYEEGPWDGVEGMRLLQKEVMAAL